MRIDIITLFPEMLRGSLDSSIIGRAQNRKLVDINLVNLRDFATDRHATVDDSPCGGGAGMVLKADILSQAVDQLRSGNELVLLLTPQGRQFTQPLAGSLAEQSHLIMVCGHYEGVDERVRQALVDVEISIGDYVLTNGSLAAWVVTDAVVRLIPGVLGSAESAETDSFADRGLLEYPHYTRPAVVREMPVPEILLSGDHVRIDKWRREQARIRTVSRRPDIIITNLHGG